MTTVHRIEGVEQHALNEGSPVVLRREDDGKWGAYTETGLIGYLDNNTATIVEFRAEAFGKPTAKITLADDVGIDLEITFPPPSA